MQITIETKPYASLETEAIVTPVFEADDPIQGRVAELDQLLGRLAEEAGHERGTYGKNLEFTLCTLLRD
jgi:hypothetical protein